MKIYELFESPVSDVFIGGDTGETIKTYYPFKGPNGSVNRQKSISNPPSDDFNTGTGFNDIDKKLVNTSGYKNRVINAFKNTPYNFEIYLANSKGIDGSSENDNLTNIDIISSSNSAITNQYGGIVSEKGKIKIVMISNLSPPDKKIPATPWIIAHKIGHTLQDHGDAYDIDEQIYKISSTMARLKYGTKTPDQFINDFVSYVHTGYDNNLFGILTSKSKNNIDNEYEIFPELVAQFLINGKVTLNVDESMKKHETKINRCMHKLFKGLYNKVVVIL